MPDNFDKMSRMSKMGSLLTRQKELAGDAGTAIDKTTARVFDMVEQYVNQHESAAMKDASKEQGKLYQEFVVLLKDMRHAKDNDEIENIKKRSHKIGVKAKDASGPKETMDYIIHLTELIQNNLVVKFSDFIKNVFRGGKTEVNIKKGGLFDYAFKALNPAAHERYHKKQDELHDLKTEINQLSREYKESLKEKKKKRSKYSEKDDSVAEAADPGLTGRTEKQEPIKVGNQKIYPGDPMYDKIMGKSRISQTADDVKNVAIDQTATDNRTDRSIDNKVSGNQTLKISSIIVDKIIAKNIIMGSGVGAGTKPHIKLKTKEIQDQPILGGKATAKIVNQKVGSDMFDKEREKLEKEQETPNVQEKESGIGDMFDGMFGGRKPGTYRRYARMKGGKLLRGLGLGGASTSSVGGLAKVSRVAAPLAVGLTAASAWSSVNKADEDYEWGDISKAEAREEKSKAVGGLAGFGSGMAMGAGFGSVFGPVGTIVGGIAGGAIGAFGGSKLAGGLAKAYNFLSGDDKKPEINATESSTSIEFEENKFRNKDPENYAKFVEYREKRTKEIYEEGVKKVEDTKYATPRDKEIALNSYHMTGKKSASMKANMEAIKKFKKEIESAGVGKVVENKSDGKKPEINATAQTKASSEYADTLSGVSRDGMVVQAAQAETPSISPKKTMVSESANVIPEATKAIQANEKAVAQAPVIINNQTTAAPAKESVILPIKGSVRPNESAFNRYIDNIFRG